MIKVENLIKVYPGNVKALEGISFNIKRGEVCGYLGGNGAGKSTTIKIICGMISPSGGQVFIDGINAADEPDKVKKIIGYVPESGALFLSLTPYDFLQFVCRMYDIEKDVYDGRINSFMELFGMASEINVPMHTFSKGMRQKVLLISSLIHDPEVILWDEPLGGIDYETTQVVRELVRDLAAAGKTFFYSTHIVESVDKICTKVIVLNKGRAVFEGSIDGRILESVMNEYSRTAGSSEKISGLYKNISS